MSLRRQPRPNPDCDRITVARSTTCASNVTTAVSVPRAPWTGAFAGHDPRNETRPRMPAIRHSQPRPDMAALFIAALRDELAAFRARSIKK